MRFFRQRAIPKPGMVLGASARLAAALGTVDARRLGSYPVAPVSRKWLSSSPFTGGQIMRRALLVRIASALAGACEFDANEDEGTRWLL
jgi:hypothetical protein